jgi:hypothetical protein
MDDFERGYASAPRRVYTGEPDNYTFHDLKPGDKIPEGAKSRPWFLGRPDTPAIPPKKPAAKKPAAKKRTTKKK